MWRVKNGFVYNSLRIKNILNVGNNTKSNIL